MIWYRPVKVSDLAHLGKDTMGEAIGIEITEIGSDFIRATMPVDARTKQPYGILHGGASVALAETIGSFGSHLIVDDSKFMTVGLEINANHIRKVSEGIVTGTATPIHIGRKTHIWNIEIHNELGKLVCICRLTVAVIPKMELGAKA